MGTMKCLLRLAKRDTLNVRSTARQLQVGLKYHVRRVQPSSLLNLVFRKSKPARPTTSELFGSVITTYKRRRAVIATVTISVIKFQITKTLGTNATSTMKCLLRLAKRDTLNVRCTARQMQVGLKYHVRSSFGVYLKSECNNAGITM